MAAFQLLSTPRWLSVILGYWGLLAGGSMLLTSAAMVWSSKVGKLRQRQILIDSLKLNGAETVLDVGCGRGLLLIEAAKHLPNGKAIGVDLWQMVDQSGNRPQVTLENARAEGVYERVEVKTGDMRDLPLPDASVDVVVASLSIHNIPDAEGRAQAIREIHRVLRPGGGIALLDFQATDEYLATLRSLGWDDLHRSGLSFRMFPPVRVVRGKKPA
jgi:ubiquinone/menaquinone biosynthesis C-methylase UbiE